MNSELRNLKSRTASDIAYVTAQAHEKAETRCFVQTAMIDMIRDRILTRLILDLGSEVRSCNVDLGFITEHTDIKHKNVRVQLHITGCAPIDVFYHSMARKQKPGLSVPIYGIRITPARYIVSDLGKFHSVQTLGEALILAEIEGSKFNLGEKEGSSDQFLEEPDYRADDIPF